MENRTITVDIKYLIFEIRTSNRI